MTKPFDEFMEDIQSDIRQERYLHLWHRYGKKLLVLCVFCLMGLLGYNLWARYQTHQLMETSLVFHRAQELMSQGQKKEALEALRLLDKASNSMGSYGILGKLNQASLLGEGDPAERHQAMALYDDVLSLPQMDSLWKDFALYQKTLLTLEMSKPNLGGLLKELENVKDTSPLGPLLMELKAAILWQKGDIPQAKTLFLALAQNASCPEGIRMRSKLMCKTLPKSSSVSQ